jgi:SAM-dependent MidA family methyltransferase
MELALYGPEGYFMGESVRSTQAGDFLTSPEVSPLFGATLAEFVREEHARLGDPFTLVEVGAGGGSLLRYLLLAYSVDSWAVEISPPARQRLENLLPDGRVVSSIEELPFPVRGVVIANELIDNLPMALAQKEVGRWRERWVGLEDDALVLVDADPRPEVVAWLEQFAGPVADGGWVEVQLQALDLLRAIISRLNGAVLVIDYGETAENLAHRRASGTLRTYQGHHLGPDPLLAPGTTDITADVNFSALIATAHRLGASAELVRQDDFLRRYGLDQKLRDLRDRELAEAGRDERLRLEARSQRTAGETLLHERGLGDFRVLVVRSPNGR